MSWKAGLLSAYLVHEEQEMSVVRIQVGCFVRGHFTCLQARTTRLTLNAESADLVKV
jgi:hypothetical protein